MLRITPMFILGFSRDFKIGAMTKLNRRDLEIVALH
jgi:hypothetical protein